MSTSFNVLLLLSLLFPAAVKCLYTSSDDVTILTPQNFNKALDSSGVWLIEFYAPWCGHCKSLAPEWKKAATILKGVVNIGAVDADEHKSLGATYGVTGFPTIKIFGPDKKSPKDYQGGRTAEGIVQAAMKEASDLIQSRMRGGTEKEKKQVPPSDDVILLTDDNFDSKVLNNEQPWLVEFFAPWCGHCKNLAPHWSKAATELKGKFNLGTLDATVHQLKASEYGVKGYPAIKYFPAGSIDSSFALDYESGRTSSDIIAWALNKWSVNLPAPEVLQLVEQTTLNACLENSLCVISFLPHILDSGADGRNQYIELLKQLGDKYKQRGWGWSWSEGGSQSKLEESLEIGGFGYPALAVINSRKNRFALLKGAYAEDGINDLLRTLLAGRAPTYPIQGTNVPVVISTEPWDGLDGQLPEDDDMDLSNFSWDDEPAVADKEEL